ncbi:MAG: tRNA pseudouridine(55) synthase TruB [Dehalococcoidia bacterium]|nr:tRNA pseudouridine(55) synthase TruB [Dehalococcoidia bacterium]
MGVNGILNVNKHPGYTSFKVVAAVRRITGEKRVGHAGTLDPAASGVLPVCLGQATRITEYLHNFSKEYVAEIELGTTTDTFDREGKVTGKNDTGYVTYQILENSLISFLGSIDQVPPAYSAVKINGRRSYDLARESIPVSHRPRRVTIERLEILEFERPYLKIKILCSKGTYIRSLASDLGELLGCGAYLKDLVRTAYGPFEVRSSITIDDIRSALADGSLGRLLFPLDFPLQQWQSRYVAEETALEISRGQDIPLDTQEILTDLPLRVYNPVGKFLAVMVFMPETSLWHPAKVFNL